jgi:two-component system response regulator PilR (NtrC family)
MKTVLVTDDDQTCRDAIQMVLQREGYEVETAPDVDRALEALGARHFDLVVCDYRMPRKTGLDLLSELRQQQSHIPVLMISAFADATAQCTALSLGASDFLKKPLRRQALVDSARKAIQP